MPTKSVQTSKAEPVAMETGTQVAVSVIEVSRKEHIWTLAEADVLELLEFIIQVIFNSTVCLFGITANLINIVIFIKQGLDNTINISLLGIALSDLISLVALAWRIFCLNPYAEKANFTFIPGEIQYLTGGWPHLCFTRITCFITLYITAERCICIALPLKVKQIITPARTKCIVISIFLLMFASVVPEYSTVYFGLKYKPDRNRTVLGILFTSTRKRVVGFVFIFHSILGISSFLAVAIITVILVIKLRQKSKWRQKSTCDNEQNAAMSSRDKKTVTMVLLIATILIICFIPTVTLLTVAFIVREFSITGKYSSIFHVMWSLAFFFEAVNSSVNIFLYYNMSSKYRQTFNEIFSVGSTVS